MKKTALISASAMLLLITGCELTRVSERVRSEITHSNLKSHSEKSAKLSTIKESVVWLTNNYRSNKGKDELFVNPRLSALARKHSEDMALGRVGFGHGG
ncbi:MAG TPA: CAP domain-containing protein, partial [Kamptonema sp.]|nr:CAP domain-containing protein [Kamptonema sp.]